MRATPKMGFFSPNGTHPFGCPFQQPVSAWISDYEMYRKKAKPFSPCLPPPAIKLEKMKTVFIF
jgi:hypothetical protein